VSMVETFDTFATLMLPERPLPPPASELSNPAQAKVVRSRSPPPTCDAIFNVEDFMMVFVGAPTNTIFTIASHQTVRFASSLRHQRDLSPNLMKVVSDRLAQRSVIVQPKVQCS
jgi:hypothetical protein